MLNQEQLETLLSYALKSEADFAEIFEEETSKESVSMVNDDVQDVNHALISGAGIRLYKGNQSVYAHTNEMDMTNLKNLIDDLRDAIGRKEEGPRVILHPEEVTDIHKVEVSPLEASLEEKISLMKRAADAARAKDERIVKAMTSIANVEQKVQISNSDGRLVRDTRHRTRLACTAYASENGKMQQGTASPGASRGLEFYREGDARPEAIGEEAARTALVLLSAKPAPSGYMPVIIDNGFGGVIFHESCGHSLEATAVAKNQSVFSGKKGTQIASSKVTAIDDGTIPNAWGSQNVDDEGNPQRKRVLIQDGILTEYMIDQLNGRRMHAPSSGSGRRESYKYEPTSRMSNTYIAAGTDKKEDMFKDIQFGLYAKKMGGGSVNPNTGEFNFGVNEAYLIEDGEITVPVHGAMLIGSGKEILMNIDMVSDNLERAQGMCGSVSGSIPTDVGQPAIRVSGITVGGTDHE